MKTKASRSERIFSGTWHAALVPLHLIFMVRSKTFWARFLEFGAVVWHLDAAIADYTDEECMLKRGIRKITRSPVEPRSHLLP